MMPSRGRLQVRSPILRETITLSRFITILLEIEIASHQDLSFVTIW